MTARRQEQGQLDTVKQDRRPLQRETRGPMVTTGQHGAAPQARAEQSPATYYMLRSHHHETGDRGKYRSRAHPNPLEPKDMRRSPAMMISLHNDYYQTKNDQEAVREAPADPSSAEDRSHSQANRIQSPTGQPFTPARQPRNHRPQDAITSPTAPCLFKHETLGLHPNYSHAPK